LKGQRLKGELLALCGYNTSIQKEVNLRTARLNLSANSLFPQAIRSRGQRLVSSIKVEVKKKHVPFGWNFSCFAAQVMEQNLF
jgi:hypothetical protein